MNVEQLEREYEDLPMFLTHRDEQIGRRCCFLALEALRNDCYGIGAVLIDGNGDILAEGYNRVFEENYRAAAHAEMELLDEFEQRFPDYGDRSGLTMIVSLEPCPMCFTRILASGIGRVRYLAADADGGMIHKVRHLPAAWKNLASVGDYRVADASHALRDFAAKLAESGLSDKRKRLISQIRG
ncbi:nucleoside deaminase [Pontibacterium granulatum]|uniref:nucleoside deaminase n=1 Tax=Pontibacterium granulatum TaxID=2036029 RepID=UPI00249CCE0A|nr:nucleoside deaminase [Pontibacterium granulatum]MDI3325619.1 nucleoside deaminase [Pontibacterium granulatum]